MKRDGSETDLECDSNRDRCPPSRPEREREREREKERVRKIESEREGRGRETNQLN